MFAFWFRLLICFDFSKTANGWQTRWMVNQKENHFRNNNKNTLRFANRCRCLVGRRCCGRLRWASISMCCSKTYCDILRCRFVKCSWEKSKIWKKISFFIVQIVQVPADALCHLARHYRQVNNKQTNKQQSYTNDTVFVVVAGLWRFDDATARETRRCQRQ